MMLNIKKKAVYLLIVLVSLYAAACGGQDKPDFSETQAEYTEENPGKWADKVSDHLPKIEILQKQRDNVLIYVILKDASDTHYIEKIGVIDADNKILHEKSFGRGRQNSYNAWFTMNLSDYKGKELKVYAKCSRHDLWVKMWAP
ncbi:MAG: desulfoferrodoxin family protein [Spirochaetia bacterium]|nr:desulfoferrodoxin family protein [Spirochaetia bacterium]